MGGSKTIYDLTGEESNQVDHVSRDEWIEELQVKNVCREPNV